MQKDVQRHSRINSFRFERFFQAPRQAAGPVSMAGDRRSLRDVFEDLVQSVYAGIRFDHLGIGLYDPAANVVDVVLQAGAEQLATHIPVRPESLGTLLDQQKPIEVSDVATEQSFPDLCKRVRSGGFRSFRVVPLTTDRQRLGALAVLRRTPGAFSYEDTHYLEHAAQLISLVLENTLMADALKCEKRRLEKLLEVGTVLVSNLDLQNLLREISASIRQIVRHDYTHLALHDETSDTMTFHILGADYEPALISPETQIPVWQCPAGICYQKGETLEFDASDMQRIGSDYTKHLLSCGVQRITCFPMVSRGRKIGTLGLSSKSDQRTSEQDRNLLSQIAVQVAIAVDNAIAYDEIARLKDRLAKEKVYLEQELQSEHNFGEVVGNSQALRSVLKQVEIASPSEATVLILGETGTGKELIARAVHRLSSRRDASFIKLNCAAIPTGLLESELFGHEKGAFTGAVNQKIGRLELADKGTLFLDEVGEIPTELQPKLLRVLQDHEFERLGGVKTIRVDVRLVAATNRDLAQAVEQRQFRPDLYYRLNVFPIRVPALRERLGDIPLLVHYFVQKFARRMSKNIESIPSELIREFERWHWPGNVRELENFIERSVILTQGKVFFAPMTELRNLAPDTARSPQSTLEAIEREYILRTLRESGGVIAGVHGAAARLGMKRTTLQSRIQKLGITRSEYES